MHTAGQPLTIAADREIHGLGDLSSSSSAQQVDVYGKLLADDGMYGIYLARFHVHAGAVVDLGNGGGYSGTLAPDHRSSISGGILRARYLSISGGLLGEFLHTGGDATFGTISFGSDTTYRLTGGSLTIGRKLAEGRIDFDHSSAQLRLADRAYMEMDKIIIRDKDNASFAAGTDSLLVIAPGFDPDAEFASFSSDGIVHVRGETLVVPEGYTITGAIELPDPVINHGSVEPGFVIGKMRVHGDYIQESTGTLVIEIGDLPSQNGFDQLGISGDAWLDGRLEVRLIDGFIPFTGLTYPIVTAVGIHGTFADGISTLDVLGGGTFDVVYDEGLGDVLLTNYRAEVLPDLPGDFDIDGDVDRDDLSVWQTNFGRPGPQNHGDADGDNDVDGNDFLIWQRHFGTDDSGMAAPNAIPEPTGMALLTIVLMFLSGMFCLSRWAVRGCCTVIMIVLLVGTAPRWAAADQSLDGDIFWTNPGIGNWDDPANWSAGVPIPGTHAVIDNGGTAQILTDGDISDRPDHTWIGRNDSGTLEHLAGNRIFGSITLAQNIGSTGTLIFGGDAIGQYAAIQHGQGTGSVTITGGLLTVNTFYADQSMPCYHSGGTVVVEYMYRLFGRYELSGSAHLQIDEYNTRFDHGEFVQSGGHLDISGVDFDDGAVYRMQGGSATLARAAVHDGLIELSGGELDLGNLILPPPGIFQAGGNMVVRGGTLIISDSIEPGAAPITFEPGEWTIDTRGGIANYSNANMPDVTQASLTSSVDTITLLPAGINTSHFASFTPLGIVHVAGSPLMIPRPARINGVGDFTDHLVVDGVLIARRTFDDDYGAIHAYDGIEISGTAFVNLAEGSLTVNDNTSGIFGGALRAKHLNIGFGATGRFLQHGGSFGDGDNSSGGPIIHVGEGAGGNGYYELSGGGIEA
ncbi:MAG: hypothetical protein JW829_09740, partial [Pirellulales bacterium]|nr:hypothetical protein [Pirellulales bacterium]